MTREDLIHSASLLIESGDLMNLGPVVDELMLKYPRHHESNLVAGRRFLSLGKHKEALQCFEQVIRINPFAPEGHYWIGRTFETLEVFDQATKAYLNSLRIKKSFFDAYLSLGQLYIQLGQDVESISVLEQAIRIRPESGAAKLALSQALAILNRGEEARAYLEAALSDPSVSASAKAMLGYWYQSRGQFDQAKGFFEDSINDEPNQSVAYYGWFQSRKVSADDLAFLSRVEQVLQEVKLKKHDEAYLRYSLGKAYGELGDYARSMQEYRVANQLAFQQNLNGKPFRSARYQEIISDTISTFTPELLAHKVKRDSNSQNPIFVVGMMRSGTTLVEQILSSHPDVHGAGELSFWLDEGEKACHLAQRTVNLPKVTELSANYLTTLKQASNSAAWIVDKMPQNIQMAGLIHVACPDSPIIHIRRNPLDTCLSIYFTAYQQSPDFAHVPESIVLAYREYERLAAHWESVLPKDRFLTIEYEKLIDGPEDQIRSLATFCGLSWDQEMLHPEKNERLVTTPSLWQVRQPMNKSAIGRWKPYEPFLEGFAELLP